MNIKIGINGFGRIGMLTAKVILDKFPQLKIAAVNDLTSPSKLKQVFSQDPVYGAYQKPMSALFLAEKDPAKLPWQKLGVEIVLECTGFFTNRAGAGQHLTAGAKKVIISAPASAKDAAGKPNKFQGIPTYLLGVNEKNYNQKKDHIVSMGSCTTNASAVVLKILDEQFGLKNAFLNTVHSYTASQNKIFPNWQEQKASQLSIIPSSTGATKTVEKAVPKLKGKLDGLALRVPTATVSIVELVCLLKKKAAVPEINSALRKASRTRQLKKILKVEKKSLISADYIKSPYSSVVAAGLTQSFGNLARVFAWYDNEYGYACRLAEMTQYIAKRSECC